MSFARRIRTLCLVLPLVALSAVAARAADAAFVIRNPSATTIHYQVKWGDGSWKSYCLGGHRKMSHSHKLDCNGRAPAPRIRFDSKAGDGRVTYSTWRAGFYSVSNCWSGKSYHFDWSRCGCYLSLYAD